jgi:pimeloyl-ACP methyl ester carboxylesterase
VRRLRAPLLLVHGGADAKLAPEHSRRLLAAAQPADKTLVEVGGAGHDDLLGRAETWDAVDRFLDRVVP